MYTGCKVGNGGLQCVRVRRRVSGFHHEHVENVLLLLGCCWYVDENAGTSQLDIETTSYLKEFLDDDGQTGQTFKMAVGIIPAP